MPQRKPKRPFQWNQGYPPDFPEKSTTDGEFKEEHIVMTAGIAGIEKDGDEFHWYEWNVCFRIAFQVDEDKLGRPEIGPGPKLNKNIRVLEQACYGGHNNFFILRDDFTINEKTREVMLNLSGQIRGVVIDAEDTLARVLCVLKYGEGEVNGIKVTKGVKMEQKYYYDDEDLVYM